MPYWDNINNRIFKKTTLKLQVKNDNNLSQKWDFTCFVSSPLCQSHHLCRGEFLFHTLLGCAAHTSLKLRYRNRQIGLEGGLLKMDLHVYSWISKQPKDEHKWIHQMWRWLANTLFMGTMSLLIVKGSGSGQGHQMLIFKVCVLPDSQMK